MPIHKLKGLKGKSLASNLWLMHEIEAYNYFSHVISA